MRGSRKSRRPQLLLAKSCVRQDIDIAPNLGEADLAQAVIVYHGYHDYAHARQHLRLLR